MWEVYWVEGGKGGGLGWDEGFGIGWVVGTSWLRKGLG